MESNSSMMPLLSETKTRPSGAQRIDVGSVRPVQTAVSVKPLGSERGVAAAIASVADESNGAPNIESGSAPSATEAVARQARAARAPAYPSRRTARRRGERARNMAANLCLTAVHDRWTMVEDMRDGGGFGHPS